MGLYGVPFAKPTVSLAPCFNFKKLARNLARCQVHFRSAEKGEKARGHGGMPLAPWALKFFAFPQMVWPLCLEQKNPPSPQKFIPSLFLGSIIVCSYWIYIWQGESRPYSLPAGRISVQFKNMILYESLWVQVILLVICSPTDPFGLTSSFLAKPRDLTPPRCWRPSNHCSRRPCRLHDGARLGPPVRRWVGQRLVKSLHHSGYSWIATLTRSVPESSTNELKGKVCQLF